jgi:N-acetylneuraminic acid mutarotase
MDAEFASTQVWAFDPATDVWSRRAPLPQGLTHVSVAGLDGRLYALGGFTDPVHINPQPTVFTYDPATDTWATLAPMPRALGSVAVAVVHGRLHVLGGRDSRRVVEVPMPEDAPPLSEGLGTVNAHAAFDPATATWTELAPIPGPPRDHVGVAVLDGRIHLFGGREEEFEQNLDRHDIYDPATDSWSIAAPLPMPRSAGASAVIEGRIIYAGGECRPGGQPFTPNTFDEVEAYDPAADAWTALPPLPQGGRHGFGAGVVGDAALFAGGAQFCGGGATTDLLELTLR